MDGPRIITDFPPLFDEIDAAFHVAGPDVIYAWGDAIYNPRGLVIPPELIEHEATHGRRQGRDITGWWRRYIEDPAFRRNEEIFAHVAEYRWLIENGNRSERRQALKRVAEKLASPLYGRLVTPRRARSLLSSAGKRNEL